MTNFLKPILRKIPNLSRVSQDSTL